MLEFIFIIFTFSFLNPSYSLPTKSRLVEEANTLIDARLKELIKSNMIQMPARREILENSIGTFNFIVNSANLLGLNTTKRIRDCEISENSTVILCPIRVNQVVASYGKSDSISGSVEFNILIEIDSNERILDIQTNSLKFLEENPGKYFNWLSNIGKTIEKEVKKEVATTVGVAVGNAVKVAVTGLTANPVLGVAAGIVAGVIVKDQVEKKLNN